METKWNYCSECRRNTKHSVLFSKEVRDEVYYLTDCSYQVVECNGCETVSFRLEIYELMVEDPDDRLNIETFPLFLKEYREIENTYYLPEKIQEVYNQTILAFKGKSFLLTAVGFRAIIEAICIEENIKGANLEQKINNLVKNRLITEKEGDRLHSIRFLGNDSIHDMEVPSSGKLYLVLDIIDNLLKNLYLIDKRAKRTLDTLIYEFEDFEDLIKNCLSKHKIGEEKCLTEILNRSIRRIKSDLNSLEKELINRINDGSISFLALAAQKTSGSIQVQFYEIKENTFLPF